MREELREGVAYVLRRVRFPRRSRVIDAVEAALGEKRGSSVVPLRHGGRILADCPADKKLFYTGEHEWRVLDFLLRTAKAISSTWARSAAATCVPRSWNTRRPTKWPFVISLPSRCPVLLGTLHLTPTDLAWANGVSHALSEHVAGLPPTEEAKKMKLIMKGILKTILMIVTTQIDIIPTLVIFQGNYLKI